MRNVRTVNDFEVRVAHRVVEEFVRFREHSISRLCELLVGKMIVEEPEQNFEIASGLEFDGGV